MQIVALSFIIALAASPAFAAACKWVETEGAATVANITPEEAKALALGRARLAAIENISVIKVAGATLVSDSVIASDFIQALSAGYVVEESVVGWTHEITQKKKEDAPLMAYTVKLKSCVASSGAEDAFFKVKASLDRPVYQSGDEAQIRVACSKDCFLSIFNLRADGQVRVLLPNDYEDSNGLKAGAEDSFPKKGIALEMRVLDGHKKNIEAFIVVATKERWKGASLLNRGKGNDLSMKDFYNALLALPADARAEEILIYEVRKR